MKLLIAGSLFAAGCSQASTPTIDASPRQLESSGFVLSYYGLPEEQAYGLLTYLERNRDRVMRDLQVRELPRVTITIQDEDAFRERWGDLIGESGIGFQVKGLAWHTDEIYVYGPWAVDNPGNLRQVVLHEFTHNVTLKAALDHAEATGQRRADFEETLDSTGQQSRWLWEGIAMHAAGMGPDMNRIGYLVTGNYPTLDQLNDPANDQIYSVGFWLVEYIRERWGTDGVVRLVQEHGSVKSALGLTPTEFEDQWYDWVQTRLVLSPLTKLFWNSRYNRRS